jgi:uridine phosphorylase
MSIGPDDEEKSMAMVNYSEDDRKYHTHLRPGEPGELCLLPGDPGRVAAIASRLDGAHEVASNREFLTWAGTLDGHAVSVTSTGMGSGSATECLEELSECGCATFVRVGTCGGIALDVCAGDVVIAASATHEGASEEYAPVTWPPSASWDVTRALDDAACELGFPHHVGVVHCKGAFRSQHAPQTMPNHVALEALWDAYVRLGVLASEMESASLFSVAAARGVRCGTVLAVMGNQMRGRAGLPNEQVHDTSRAIDVAILAVRHLLEG